MMTGCLSARTLLGAWERGRRQTPPERALTLLAVATPEVSASELSQLPLGERNARLLRMRASTLGDVLAAVARCDGCGEEVELVLASSEFLGASRDEIPLVEQEIVVAGLAIRFRLPNGGDLVAVTHCPNLAQARAALIARCLTGGDRDDVPAADELPAEVVDAIAARVMTSDPLAEILLALTCPACGHRWTMPLDIAEFFWTEVSAEARRLLTEVHQLAAAYGWSETDILAMSATRRHAYLELLGS